jgi:thioredoxin reductase
VLVIDSGSPRNAPADAVHGLLGREGMAPAELLARGRDEVRGYGGEVVAGEVSTVSGEKGAFTVCLAGGRAVRARRLLVATGLADELPDIPGLRARWGRDVIHCPYCHGWEVRDQAIAVLSGGPRSVHQALLFRQLSDSVVYLEHTAEPLDDEDAAQLAARGIRRVPGEVTAIEVVDDHLAGVRLADGTLVPCTALTVAAPMRARAGFLAGLGLTPRPSPAGEFIPADPTGLTSVPGVWVAGNVSDLGAQVGVAAAEGAISGAMINADLVAEETELVTSAGG